MLKNFYAPEDGASGASAQTDNDDLFEVEGSAAESEQVIDGLNAVNTPDSEGKPLKSEEAVDDEPPEEDFDTLIKGKYKEQYQANVDAIINKRFKNAKANEEKLKANEATMAKLQPLFNAMAAKYGIKADDIDAIIEAADKDNSNYEQAAYDNGYGDTAEYRRAVERDEELNRLRAAEKERVEAAEQDRQRRELLEGWLAESEEFKKEVEGFDFKSEWDGSDRFRYLVNSGFKVKEAYMAVHAAEYAKAAADKAQKDILAEIRANKTRPTESSANPQAAIRVKKSVKDMSLEDTERIIQEAKRGRKITF
jgi:hypothetical protein